MKKRKISVRLKQSDTDFLIGFFYFYEKLGGEKKRLVHRKFRNERDCLDEKKKWVCYNKYEYRKIYKERAL